MASSSPQPSVAAEDDFMRVLDEMNRLCGAGEESSPDQEKRDDSFLNNTSSPKLDQDPDPFEGIRYLHRYITCHIWIVSSKEKYFHNSWNSSKWSLAMGTKQKVGLVSKLGLKQ